ncbi:cytochrome c biogenesis protein ResB [Microbacterium radiodurans]|uniref:Cytochrome c biogenesis protein ResB n=1 Tax=Microbacterium radiodurans TaxID=661398 RepID=A0A5J5IYB7_9MICO|nr:cytochrome c biogenesis protein ResB [Microbacterium radiodurans]KAA9089825.1 cytochrome c biogenesis protein ResB [Microbacterium radiodurans]
MVSRPSSDDSDPTAPLRPGDHSESAAPSAPVSSGDGAIAQPQLGLVGWLRWGWRQLTSMRTALVLLLLLAIAAIPGSIVPQRTADPNGVTQWRTDNPDLYPILDALQLFDVYSSVWFSAIYILLFVSLIGCVIPRTKHHWQALRARPPRTPARLSRLADHREAMLRLDEDEDAGAAATAAVDAAEQQLRRSGYRVERYDSARGASVSAERGYLRETGNLVFHASLVGVLISVGVGGGLTYTGQTVITEGETFVNSLGLGYNSFNPGRFVDTDSMPPYALTLDRFDVTYGPFSGDAAHGMAGDFAAHLTVGEPGQDPRDAEVRVNHPFEIEGDRVYLMGNGYAPSLTVRNAEGTVVFNESVPFLPQDNNMTSQGVVKIADGMPDQLGLVGFFYPTAATLANGAIGSAYGDLTNPLVTFWVYQGDLGIDDGTPRSVYTLDPTGMEQIAGNDSDVASLQLEPGQTVDLPNGLGTVTFQDERATGAEESVKRYVSLSIHRDVGAPFVLVFAILATLGLLAGLFVPRRRLWVKATPSAAAIHVEYAGLARGEDPAIRAAVADLSRTHLAGLGRDEVDPPATAGAAGAASGRPTRAPAPDVD